MSQFDVTVIGSGPGGYVAALRCAQLGSMTSKTETKDVYKNAVPILMYYDIFKNYYANTQEDNFYIIGNTEKLTPDITKQERIIDIPPNTEVCHTLDLERVQYVGMPAVDGPIS